jgi:MFS family permease
VFVLVRYVHKCVYLANFVAVIAFSAGFLLVDTAGRRPLLIAGSLGCAAAMLGLSAALATSSVTLAVVSMVAYITAFSVSWAPLFWVVVSEIFSMGAKSAAMSLATACLFLFGALADLAFPELVDALHSGSFVAFGCVAALGGAFVWAVLPETKGLPLMEVQAQLRGHPRWHQDAR